MLFQPVKLDVFSLTGLSFRILGTIEKFIFLGGIVTYVLICSSLVEFKLLCFSYWTVYFLPFDCFFSMWFPI